MNGSIEGVRGAPLVDAQELESIDLFWRAANYISVAQLYLRDNVLLRRPLYAADFKPRILGHWGAIPGLNFIYAHVSAAVRRADQPVLLVVGTGHGAPAILANLYLEGTLQRYYQSFTHTSAGLTAFVRAFAALDGFQTEISAHVPSMILAGGELGPALSVAQGAALDNPELLVVCVVGDGELETGPATSALFATRLLRSTRAGTVLPIINLNGFKMGSPSLLSALTDAELRAYFGGLGYAPILAGPSHAAMADALAIAFGSLDRAAEGQEQPWPLIVLRSPKGWTGPRMIKHHKFEGAAASHKPLLHDPARVLDEAAIVETWLRSYEPEALFTDSGAPTLEVQRCLPAGDRRLGRQWERYGCARRIPLVLPPTPSIPQATLVSATEAAAQLLGQVFDLNRETGIFRLFSPDELSSNRLSSITDYVSLAIPVPTSNGTAPRDLSSGRVLEILSEHTCQGWLQGYVQTGRHGVFATYEAFAPIVASMAAQYCKFLKESLQIPWRQSVASLNYLLTSLGWHNCYTHQNPEFISTLLARPLPFIRVYTPPDANSTLACITEMLSNTDRINALVVSKIALPVWLDLPDASRLRARGAAVLVRQEAHVAQAIPDVVLAGVGDYALAECIATVELLRQHLPSLSVRLIAVCEMTVLGTPSIYPHALSDQRFTHMFTEDRSVLFSFIGYPTTLKALLLDRPNPARFHVTGYREEHAIHAFAMLIRNGASRFQLASCLAQQGACHNPLVAAVLAGFQAKMEEAIGFYEHALKIDGIEPYRPQYQPEAWTVRDE